MQKLTIKDLIEYINNMPEKFTERTMEDEIKTELIFEDGRGTGVNISEVYLEKVGNTYCLIFQNKDVSLVQ